MALWNDSKDSAPAAAPPPARASSVTDLNARTPDKPVEAPAPAVKAAPARVEAKESVIAAGLTIEGKIQGTGNVRLSGRFKGDVQVDGNVTLDAGAKLEGHVKAGVVIVSGELIGNIDGAKRVELLESGVINGDVTAGSLTVAAGSRRRGLVEFGYEGEARAAKPDKGFGNA